MSWISDNLFGGAQKDAAQQQAAAIDKASQIQQQATRQARQDILGMFSPAYQNLTSGYENAAEQIANGSASAKDVLQQSYQNAGNVLGQGTNAMMSAILGRPAGMTFQAQNTQTNQPRTGGIVPGQPGNQISVPQQQSGQPARMSGLGEIKNEVGLPQSNLASMLKQQSDVQPTRTPQPQMGAQPERLSGLGNFRENQLMTAMSPQMQNRTGGIIGQPPSPSQREQPVNNQAPTQTDQLDIPVQQLQSDMPNAPSIGTPNLSGIGLTGAEQALQGGLSGQLNQYQQGLQSGLGSLQQGLGNQLEAYQNALTGAESAVNQAAQGQTGAITEGYQAGIDQMSPYADMGQEAAQREAALSGALGADAQQQAIDSFMESPGQKYMREQAEKSLLRNASATGGLRGGSTLAALQEQAIGLSAQNQQQQLENMRSIAGRGQQAASNIAGMNVGQGQNLANVFGQQGQQLSGLRSQLGQAGANAIGNTAQQGAGMQFQAGQSGGSAMANVGSQLGQLRMGAGQQVAGQLGGLTSGLANQQLQLGNQLANIDQNTATNLANLMQSGGEQGFGSQMQLAQILANLATGQGTNLANLATQRGQAIAGGTTGAANQAGATIGTGLGALAGFFSDARLKDDAKPLVNVNGVQWYTAKYKDQAPIPQEQRGKQIVCVMAQELMQKHPELVGQRDGFLTVDYDAMKQVH